MVMLEDPQTVAKLMSEFLAEINVEATEGG
jgi:hypothetical protein